MVVYTIYNMEGEGYSSQVLRKTGTGYETEIYLAPCCILSMKQGLTTVVALHCLRIKSTQKEWSFQLYSTLWQNLQGNELSLESIRLLAQKCQSNQFSPPVHVQ